MATHESSKKRARQTIVRNTRNRANLSEMKTAIKKVLEAIEKKQFDTIDALFIETQSVIARTRRKGTIHVNNMARRISRISLAINKAKAAAQAPKV